MAVHEGLQFETTIESDSAPVVGPVLAMIAAGIEIHCLRDLTRGGLGNVLNEIAEAAGVKIAVEQPAIPVREDVHAACEMLGLDPLHVANEGRFVAFVAAKDQPRALAILRSHEVTAGSRSSARSLKNPLRWSPFAARLARAGYGRCRGRDGRDDKFRARGSTSWFIMPARRF